MFGYTFGVERHGDQDCSDIAVYHAENLVVDYTNGYVVTVEDRGDGKFVVSVSDGGVLKARLRATRCDSKRPITSESPWSCPDRPILQAHFHTSRSRAIRVWI